MPRLGRSVLSLASLVSFEVAARNDSFTHAAAELCVAQAAIGCQVKRLEDDLNTRLFTRSHRKVELTVEGQLLAKVMSEAFSRIAETVEFLRQPTEADTVVVGTTPAFSHYWLAPRLPAFRAAHPGVKLRLISENAGFDLGQRRLDVVVPHGDPPSTDAVSLASVSDEVFPVCGPALLGSVEVSTARCRSRPSQSLAWNGWTRLGCLGRAGRRWLDLTRWRAATSCDSISIRTPCNRRTTEKGSCWVGGG